MARRDTTKLMQTETLAQTNSVAYAFTHVEPTVTLVSAEDEPALCDYLATAKRPSNKLKEAAKRAKRFKFA